MKFHSVLHLHRYALRTKSNCYVAQIAFRDVYQKFEDIINYYFLKISQSEADFRYFIKVYRINFYINHIVILSYVDTLSKYIAHHVNLLYHIYL